MPALGAWWSGEQKIYGKYKPILWDFLAMNEYEYDSNYLFKMWEDFIKML